MKSAMVVGPKEIVIKEIEEPKVDGKHVIVAPKCVGICGSDIHLWEMGMLPQYKNMVMGHEHAGVVVDPGSRTDLKVGDRVTTIPLGAPCGKCEMCMQGHPELCTHKSVPMGIYNIVNGSYAEKFASEPSLVRKLPDDMSFEEAAMIEPAATPYSATKILGIKKGDKVLVAGGGIIGSLAAEWAKYWGADYVAMTEVNEFRRNKNLKDGSVDEVFDALDPEIDAKLNKATGGKGFDYFIECTGNNAAFQTGFKACKVFGTIAILGVTFKDYTFSGIKALGKQITIKAFFGYTANDFDETMQLISQKKFHVLNQHTSDCTLEEVPEKFVWLKDPKCTDVKIMIKKF